jgi:hypothetical protein
MDKSWIWRQRGACEGLNNQRGDGRKIRGGQVGNWLRDSTPRIYTHLPNRDQAHQAERVDDSVLTNHAELSELLAPAQLGELAQLAH